MEEGATFYLDSNVLINAVANDSVLGDRARKLFTDMQQNFLIAYTSCLTIDEVAWIFKRNMSNELTVESCKKLLDSNLKFLDANKLILEVALDIIKEFNLKPRDAIHVATMKINNIKTIISEDTDFDKVNWIKRRSIMDIKI